MKLDDAIAQACELKNWSFDKSGDDAYAIRVATDDGREQEVTAWRYEEDGEHIVGFQTVIGPALKLFDDKPMKALKMNHEFRHGALAVDENDNLVMVETFPEEKVDGPVSAAIIRYLARRGDMIEKYVIEQD